MACRHGENGQTYIIDGLVENIARLGGARSQRDRVMAKKLDIDWKNFFLQKGEKIGLGVGVAVLGVMLVFGIKGVCSGSPSANAAALNAKTKEAQNKLVNNKPRDDSAFQIDTALMNNSAELDVIKVDDVKAVASLF